jgi:starvation-inducible DNA-binding protein
MTELTTLHKAKESSSTVSKKLQTLLANTYGLYLATHNYHWNVEGAQFVSLHKLFDEQYNELFQAVDVIAERIRALGDYALPFEGDEIVDILKTTSNAMNKETKADARAIRMVHNLIEMNESVIESCRLAKNEAQIIVDDESENLIVERITAHQKALWMLRSIVK